MPRRYLISLLLGLLFLLPPDCGAWYPKRFAESLVPGPVDGALIGENRFYLTGPQETLIDIARRARLGFQALVNANPDVDPWSPPIGSELVLPYATLLPSGLLPGITVNLAEFRLYLLWEEDGKQRVRIYPVGLGQQGWMTPEGDFHVSMIIEDPLWTVPEAIREERPGQSALVEAGPDNPLGSHWIGLSADGYGIHGTNRPYGIGRQVSHGCIRLYPVDILDLVEKIAKGTPVKIIYQPIKLGRVDDRILLEVHPDFLERVSDPQQLVRQRLLDAGWADLVSEEAVAEALQQTRGVPSAVSTAQ